MSASTGPAPPGDAELLSVNVARPAPVLQRGGRPVVSGILKRPVLGRVAVGPTGLAGDGVGDPRVHGGPRKAVYAYPSEHFERWRAERPGLPVGPGFFGENLTIRGVEESDVRPGDLLAVGSARFVVTQPRFPCTTLALRVGDPRFVREFQRSGRSGFYLGVETVGEVAAGDVVRRLPDGIGGPTILDIVRAKPLPDDDLDEG